MSDGSGPAPTALGAAENLVEQFEGFSATPYPDPSSGGYPWAIGFGSTRDAAGQPVTPDTPPVTLDQARRLVLRDLRAALATIEGAVVVPLTVDEEAALLDFTYNLGAGNLLGSTLLRLLNAGDYAGAAAQFERWDHAGGHVMAGLLRRRLAERDLFLNPGTVG